MFHLCARVYLNVSDCKGTQEEEHDFETEEAVEVSDDNEYGDGYDSELVGDEDDREKLRAMTELQREQVIAERMDNRQRLQERRRILRMAKEKDAAAVASVPVNNAVREMAAAAAAVAVTDDAQEC